MQSFDDQAASLDTSTQRRPAERREWARWLELTLLLGGSVGLAYWSVRSGGAPAVITALLGVLPAIIGLQHGFVPALAGVLIGLSAVWLAPAGVRLESTAALLAPYALALAVGHWSDRGRRARRALEERTQGQGRQLEQLFRAHNVLRASHGQLEERLAARDWSLEAAVREAERQVGARDLAGAASALLELLTSQGRVAAASLYIARAGELPGRADARLGPVPAHEAPGRLVRMAFTHGTVVSLERDDAAADAEENVLVALPLCTTGGHVVGAVAVHELPFVAFHDAHFRLLATLIAPFTDALARKVEAGDLTARLEPSRSSSLPPPTRALERLRQTQLGIPMAPRVELPPLLPPPAERDSVVHVEDSDVRDVSDEETTASGSNPNLTIAVDVDDEANVMAVAEVVVVEFDIAVEHDEAEAHAADADDADHEPPVVDLTSANTNASPTDAAGATFVVGEVANTPVVIEVVVEAEPPAEPSRESEPEIVLTQPASRPSNDASDVDDDDPTRLHAGPPGTVTS